MKKKILYSIISLILVVSIIAPDILKVVAIETPTYISDIKIGYSQNYKNEGSADAKKALTDAGYIILDNDLNSGTGKGWSYIGYKTTTDKTKAITDLAIMDMAGGYSMNNYSATLSKYSDNIKEQGKGLLAAAKEFKANYTKGSPAAQIAYKALNYMIVKEKNNQPLADYIMSDTRTEVDFYNIVLSCDPQILTFIYTELSLGVADYQTDTWLERLSNADPNKEYSDDEYYDKAMALYPSVQKFAEAYAKAEEATASFKDEMVPKEESLTTKGTTTDSTGNALEETVNTPASKENKTVSEQDMMLRTVYILLNEKQYDGVGIGEMLANPYLSANELYPLLDSLTEGQKTVLATTGVESFATNLVNSTDKAEEVRDKAFIEIEKNAGPIKGMDLWDNAVKPEVLEDREIAMTSSAARKANSKNDLDALLRTDVTRENFDKSLQIVGGIAGAAFAVASIGWFAMSTFFGATFAFSTIVSTVAGGLAAGVGSAIATSVFSGGVAILVLAVVALLAIGFYYMVTAIQDAIEYYNPTFEPIPLEMYDYVEDVPNPDKPEETIDKYVRYDAVTDVQPDAKNQKPIDLNAWQGLKWNALYYSTDPSAGNPILANTFMVKYGVGTTNDGFSPLHKFGEVVSYNTNTHMRSDDHNGIYVSFMREGGDKVKPTGRYISDLAVFEEDKQELALARLTNNGFTPVMVDLDGSTTKYAYMGYKTTPNIDNAIIDIRVADNCDTEKLTLGDGTYAKAGKYGDKTLYYTSKSSVAKNPLACGDPILAGPEPFIIKDNIKDKPPADYQPISFISGGPAADMNVDCFNAGLVNYAFTIEPIFIYYKSSETYDKGPDYISGIAYFTSGHTVNGEKIIPRALDQYGYTFSGYDVKGNMSQNVYMGYTTTKNSKRALKKVYTYYANDKNVTLPGITTINGVGFAAAVNFDYTYRYNGHIYDEIFDRKTSYIQWDGSNSMYVTSGTSSGVAFTKDEMIFSNTPLESVKSGYYAVSNIMDSSFSAANIKKGNGSQESLYLYLPGSKPELGKYISEIVIGSAEGGEALARLALMNNLCEQELYSYANGYYYDLKAKDTDSDKRIKDLNCSIGVKRTDNKNYAITDIKIVPIPEREGKQDPPKTLNINGMTYTLIGNSDPLSSPRPYAFLRENVEAWNSGIIKYAAKDYYNGCYVYYTKNIGAGDPIVDIKPVNNEFFNTGYEATQIYMNVPSAVDMSYVLKIPNIPSLRFKRDSSNQQYISMIDGSNNSNANSAEKILAINGMSNRVNYDLNCYTGGDYIYIGYNRTARANQAITGIVSMHNNGGPATIVHKGITYYLINNRTNFNTNSSKSSDEIYLYYTKDQRAGSPIIDITANGNQNESGWETVLNTQGSYGNFNAGAYNGCNSSPATYIHFKRETVSSADKASIVASIFSTSPNPIMVTGILIAMISTGFIFIVIQKRRKRKGGTEK